MDNGRGFYVRYRYVGDLFIYIDNDIDRYLFRQKIRLAWLLTWINVVRVLHTAFEEGLQVLVVR